MVTRRWRGVGWFEALGGVLFTGIFVLAVSAWPRAQAARTVQDGVYTDAQATRGQGLYTQQCASCHGNTLGGGTAPPLTGTSFLSAWRTQPLLELANKIRNTMPADAPGKLTPQQSADLVSLLLKSGGFPSGRSELAGTDAGLKGIGWPAGPAAAQSASAGTVKSYPPLGNMAQLMRGIFFPNSNLIFTVQTHDPAEPAPKTQSAGAQSQGFSWVDWGAGIYGGWQLVDNAAIALADASPLMLTPGIRCENGRPAPVTDPDWIRFTEEMIAVSRQVYKASQSRSQEAVSDATGDLSDACLNCHQAYRDVAVGRGGRGGRGQGGQGAARGGTPAAADLTSQSGRCMPR